MSGLVKSLCKGSGLVESLCKGVRVGRVPV